MSLDSLKCPAQKISTKFFTYDKNEKSFAAEVSLLRSHGLRIFDYLGPDLEGFFLVSEKTGKNVPFVLKHQEIDFGNGDILYWEYTPGDADLMRMGVTLTIYND